ncbi:hypothetical protein [Flagellimonas iocasae]|uniref:Uncharacterized protein n=1 Tax=Flagellimonas iocasae TaxID=2055905 RepID=A0ABW4XWH0_9FLAO
MKLFIVETINKQVKQAFIFAFFLFILSCNSKPEKIKIEERISMQVETDSLVGKNRKKFVILASDVRDSIVEYIKIGGKEYANQIWLVNESKDTIGGNYFKSLINDTTSLGEITRLRFALIEPSISKVSDLFILLPRDDKKLAKDFSNIFEIELDTIQSLKNDGIPHPELSDLDLPLNHIIEFGIEYEKPGMKRVRGVIIERGKLSGKGYERRLFFDKSFYVQ